MFDFSSIEVSAALKPGDEVITVAASSAIDDFKSVKEGQKVLESWGLVFRSQNLDDRRWGYLAGNDETRNKDLNPSPRAPLLICARGGWGAARLLEQEQTWSQGWLVGFSDVTSLLWARLTAGFDGCVHGPLLTTLANEPTWSQKRLKSILFGEAVQDLQGEAWSQGTASGPLLVANLTVASSLLGTNYIPNLNGVILIFEDVGEAPYRIDRLLTQWRLSGKLKGLAGLGFGSFEKCVDLDDTSTDTTFNIETILKERTLDLGIPVVGSLPLGHRCGNAALPLGRKALLDGKNGLLRLLA